MKFQRWGWPVIGYVRDLVASFASVVQCGRVRQSFSWLAMSLSHSFSFPVSEATTSVLAHPYVSSSVLHLRRGQMRGKFRPCFKGSQPGDEGSHSRKPVGRVGAKGLLKQELAKEQS